MPVNFAQAINKCNGDREYQLKYISCEILLDGHISENDIRICIFFALQK